MSLPFRLHSPHFTASLAPIKPQRDTVHVGGERCVAASVFEPKGAAVAMNESGSAAAESANSSVREEIELTLRTIFRPGDVFEIRALIPPYKTVVGYFQYEKIDIVFGLMKSSV